MNIDKIDATQKLISSKSPIEFDEAKTRVIKQGDRDLLSKTLVPFFPLREKVIIRAVFEESQMVVKSEEMIKRSDPKYQIVVGVGPEVNGIELLDEVRVGFNANIEPIKFPGNTKSIKEIAELVANPKIKLNPVEANSKKVVMIEYYIIPAISISGVVINK